MAGTFPQQGIQLVEQYRRAWPAGIGVRLRQQAAVEFHAQMFEARVDARATLACDSPGSDPPQ